MKKRFFDEGLIRDCFEGMETGIGIGMEIGEGMETGTGMEKGIGELREYVCTKYPKEKVVWEFACLKLD